MTTPVTIVGAGLGGLTPRTCPARARHPRNDLRGGALGSGSHARMVSTPLSAVTCRTMGPGMSPSGGGVGAGGDGIADDLANNLLCVIGEPG